uniref:Uncharacterized protein n=1 Tax=Spongospora subterranea TaxID=70186 RepID=A0A0H5R4Y6_9EUKA|eukprot:CRZ09213.1 hypothetical protein [Spongospora subterranea]
MHGHSARQHDMLTQLLSGRSAHQLLRKVCCLRRRFEDPIFSANRSHRRKARNLKANGKKIPIVEVSRSKKIVHHYFPTVRHCEPNHIDEVRIENSHYSFEGWGREQRERARERKEEQVPKSGRSHIIIHAPMTALHSRAENFDFIETITNDISNSLRPCFLS